MVIPVLLKDMCILTHAPPGQLDAPNEFQEFYRNVREVGKQDPSGDLYLFFGASN